MVIESSRFVFGNHSHILSGFFIPESLDIFECFAYTQYMSTYSISIRLCQSVHTRFIVLAEAIAETDVARGFIGKYSFCTNKKQC
jgi:hypothetical protein